MNLNNELYTIVEEHDNAVKIQLRAESVIFKAHFPENPITPGVCQVGIVEELAEKLCGEKLSLREVKTLKYTDILRPSTENVEVKFDKLEAEGDVVAAKGTVASGGQVFTKFSLIFANEA